MLPEPVREYVLELNERVSDALGEGLVGVYVHGSAAMGGWHPDRSDVDVLVVVARRLSAAEKTELGAAIQAVEAPGAGLECSVVVQPLGIGLTPRLPFELHVATGAGAKVVDGAGHPGDSDLVMHYAVCRERGVAVSGPAPAVVFPEAPRPMLLASFRDELAWGLEHAPAHYAVLNACRAWAYAEDSRLLSKIEGADWALARGIEPDVVGSALAAQRGEPATLDARAVERLVRAATAVLDASLAPAEGRAP